MRWNLKNRLGFFFVFIMLAAGVGMSVLYSISITTQEQLISGASQANKNIQLSGEDGIDNVLLVRELQSALLEQMLLWKNLLVRGKFQDMQAKYAEAFEKGDARIVAMLAAGQKALARDAAAQAQLQRITEEYDGFKKQKAIGQSMIGFQENYYDGIRAADQ